MENQLCSADPGYSFRRFSDIDLADVAFNSDDENAQLHEPMDSDWEDVRDDSSINISLDDTANLSSIRGNSMSIHPGGRTIPRQFFLIYTVYSSS